MDEALYADVALYGKDATPRILDVQSLREGADVAMVRVYRRADSGEVYHEDERLWPFFFLSDAEGLRGFSRDRFRFQTLDGDQFYRYAVAFETWSDYWDALRHVERQLEARERRPEEIYRVPSPAQQYLMQTGRTLFKGMDFDDLHRLQLDIEVAADSGFPNANRPGDAVIIVAISDNRGFQRLLHGLDFSEPELLRETLRVVAERDPDVIEGHNLYAFDLPYLETRCARFGIPFALGRDGSEPRKFASSMRFAERSIEYDAYEIAGRHVVDTLFQVMSYDVFKRDLPGYGLKVVAKYFGFAPEGRTYVEGGDISRVWREDPQKLLAYALDDVIETERIARHLSGSTFYLTQMLPMPYGQVARTGPAAKIEALFVREYLRRRTSFPKAEWGSQAVGGYTDVFVTGSVGPIVYADVESLYPSIMLHYDVKPGGDTLDLFPNLLRRLTDLRFEAKGAMKSAATADDRSSLDARQSSYKILVNCFSPDTEIFTADGPKPVAAVRVGDLVYAIHPQTLEPELKPVVATQAQHYTGPMVEIKTPFVDFLVTPEHRFLTSKHTGGRHIPFAWERAIDLLDDRTRRRLPAMQPLPVADPAPERFSLASRCEALGIPHKTGPRGIKELRRQARWQPESYALGDWLEFVGWYVSEGTLYRSQPRQYENGHVRGIGYRVTICQKNENGCARLRTLLDRMGLACTQDRNGFQINSRVLYEVLEYDCGRGSFEKHLPEWIWRLPPECLTRLFEAIMWGDGHRDGTRYTTASDRLARDFARLALHVGRRVYPLQHDGCHRFQVNRTRGQSPTVKPHQRRLVPYDGMVHCLTVADHHTVLAGRNGLFNWCGQSFYGMLGFGMAAFNDFAEADRVAATGQDIVRQMMRAIEKKGGRVVEVDTDGVLFVPPPEAEGEAAERQFVQEISAEMPEGIRIGFDGRFARMLSYKKKNYALLDYDGHLKFKGSSLVSRSIERFGRQYVREAVRLLLDEDIQALHDLYLRYRDRILAHDWKDVDSFSRTETLKDSIDQYRADVAAGKRTRAASYELAIQHAEATGLPVRVGDRISYYVTGTGPNVTTYDNSRLAAEWNPAAPDENTAYYLKRLDEFSRKFEPFFSEHDFRLVFSPEDLFGFSPTGIRLRVEERPSGEHEDVVPF